MQKIDIAACLMHNLRHRCKKHGVEAIMVITSRGLTTSNLAEVREAARICLELLIPYEESPWDEIQDSADALNQISMMTDKDERYTRHLITASYMYVYARYEIGSGADTQADSFPAILATEDFASTNNLDVELDTDEYIFVVNLLERFIEELDGMDEPNLQ